ncbi:MAG: hypothetical protein V3T83_12775 [Acidobacteriota bacterium]
MSNIFRHDDYEVTQAPGGFRVTEMRTQNVFFVRLEIRFGKSAAGPCSCGSAAAEVPVFECRHQRAVFALLRQRYLSNLARRGLFRHPERLTKFERDQRRLLHAFSRALRAGPPPCPHCGRTITAEDLARQEEGIRRQESGIRKSGHIELHTHSIRPSSPLPSPFGPFASAVPEPSIPLRRADPAIRATRF